MIEALTTTTMLLEGLCDPRNEPAWREFHARYQPIILAFARKLGLNETDAEDTAQEALLGFVKEYRAGKYQRGRGRLRSWIMAMVRTRVAALKRRQAGRRELPAGSAADDVMDEARLTRLWEQEHRREIVRRAFAELRTHTRLNERTIRAFELFVLEERPAADVAEQLQISANDVYISKHRVAEHLRDIVTRLEGVYDEG